ncbi:hypothetical protein VTJ04DRAFT_9257 [Mycothermus thermophilus]|uniref:uncharacterized protein n=1 Tax=Humicola insolens TaxID=85995 RepID=UPI003744379C
MMLARSPATSTATATTSPSARLQTVHYAPNHHNSRQSSPRVPAVAKSRWQSASPNSRPSARTERIETTDNSSSTAPRNTQNRYVLVDAAARHLPMDPTHDATGNLTRRPDPSGSTAATTTTTSTSSQRRPANSVPGSAAGTPKTSAPAGPKQRVDPASAVSPSASKRRNSQGADNGRPTDVGSSHKAALSKRPRTADKPPKILPPRYEHCPVEDMVVLIAHMLGELIETNDKIALRSGRLTRFHSRTAPGISVLDYLHRLAKHATLTPPLLLSMVYYIDRLCALYPDFTINTLTVHRFLITAATVAAKGLSDAFWNNSTYARVGGVKVAELNVLELEFLRRVDWKIVPNPDVLVAYYAGLVERCPGYALEGQEEKSPAEGEQDETDITDEESEVDEDDADDAIQEESRVEGSG